MTGSRVGYFLVVQQMGQDEFSALEVTLCAIVGCRRNTRTRLVHPSPLLFVGNQPPFESSDPAMNVPRIRDGPLGRGGVGVTHSRARARLCFSKTWGGSGFISALILIISG